MRCACVLALWRRREVGRGKNKQSNSRPYRHSAAISYTAAGWWQGRSLVVVYRGRRRGGGRRRLVATHQSTDCWLLAARGHCYCHCTSLHELERLALGDLHEAGGHDHRAYRDQATRRILQAPQDPARRGIPPLVGRDRPRLARGMRRPWTTTTPSAIHVRGGSSCVD